MTSCIVGKKIRAMGLVRDSISLCCSGYTDGHGRGYLVSICSLHGLVIFIFSFFFFSSPEQCSGRAIVLPPALALALASTNVKVFVKVFKTSLFPNLITDLIHLWYDDTYWSKILRSIIPTTLGHVKVTNLEFSC